ncbi:MAG TPA: RNA polymerase sigma factor [Polyangiaceae bacterium]
MTPAEPSPPVPALKSPFADAKRESSAVDRAMARYSEGDDLAFEEVFRELSPRLRAFLRRMSGRKDLADDLTQETFLRMHRARGSFVPGREAVPWAYAIARNCFIDHSRAAVRVRGITTDSDETDTAPAGPEADAEQTIQAKQMAAVVERTLASMTVARREAFVLLRYEGLSVATAAQILGVSETALKVRAFHAYESLRSALKTL